MQLLLKIFLGSVETRQLLLRSKLCSFKMLDLTAECLQTEELDTSELFTVQPVLNTSAGYQATKRLNLPFEVSMGCLRVVTHFKPYSVWLCMLY